MDIIPAIDLLGGACVRLRQGRYDSARRYSEDPSAVARGFERAGVRWIHLVDLDAARGGGDNREAIRRVRRAVACRLEVGGGIRSEQDLHELERAGAERLVLGTVLAAHPERVAAWRDRFCGELWAGIDALQGRVRVDGWGAEAGLEDRELAQRAAELGLKGIVYTSIARDGTLEGPDLEAGNRIAEASGLPVILSGGIGRAEDVESVYRRRLPAVIGVIVGRALYEGRVDLAELLRRYA
jgi:phosphoribosylformimino-5-aminoimidazole carboxamide ribotide isomerase